MLHLIGTPRWQQGSGPAHALPVCLPSALLLHLACESRWIERDTLVALFWPQADRETGRHHLRVNLHRAKQLLAEQLPPGAWQAERSRVRLTLLVDVHAWTSPASLEDGGQLMRWDPAAWLQGFQLESFEGFLAWSEVQRAGLERRWQTACQKALSLAPSPSPPWHASLSERWQAVSARLDLDDDAPASGHPPVAATGVPGHEAAGTGFASLCNGREALVQQLRRTGVQASVLLAGPGMGKTTLLRAAHPHAPWLHGREGLQQIPYRPVAACLLGQLAAVRRLMHGDQHPGLAAYRLDLSRLLPDLAPDDPLPPLDMATAKSRLLEGLARVLEALSPWWMVDDLQWCDAATLELLGLLAHRGRLRWRATLRSPVTDDGLQRWLKQEEQVGRLALHAVPGLSLQAVASSCRTLRPERAWSYGELERLQLASGGNPFVLKELLRAMPAGSSQVDWGVALQVPRTVRQLIGTRLDALPLEVKVLVQVAALGQRPWSLQVLGEVAQVMGGMDDAALLKAAQVAIQAEMLKEEDDGLTCGHDLVRQSVAQSLGVTLHRALHRQWAQVAGGRAEGRDEPLAVAWHWQQAQEPQQAMRWWLSGAEQLKRRGRFAEARALWLQVADEAADRTQALQARLALAQCELFTDLASGREALLSVLSKLDRVPDQALRQRLQVQTLSGLVENAVFAGHVDEARAAASALQSLLPQVDEMEQLVGLEALIELAMREPDLPAASRWLAQMKRLAPSRPVTLSLQAQVHWFEGDVRAACAAFEALLARHPDHCQGLTIENDLAVMLQALGRLDEAEHLARRSLASWQGVPHTQTLSWLVLGSVLTSAGRHAEARSALDEALTLAHLQASSLFLAEGLLRRARLHAQSAQWRLALDDLTHAEPVLKDSAEPLRVSLQAWLKARVARALGLPDDAAWFEQAGMVLSRSRHPLCLGRLAGVCAERALMAGHPAEALAAGQRLVGIAQAAGLVEMQVEGLMLMAEASPGTGPAAQCLSQALDLSHEHGLRTHVDLIRQRQEVFLA